MKMRFFLSGPIFVRGGESKADIDMNMFFQSCQDDPNAAGPSMSTDCGWVEDKQAWVLPEDGGFTATARIALDRVRSDNPFSLKVGDRASIMP